MKWLPSHSGDALCWNVESVSIDVKTYLIGGNVNLGGIKRLLANVIVTANFLK